jgi:hypothetical protein
MLANDGLSRIDRLTMVFTIRYSRATSMVDGCLLPRDRQYCSMRWSVRHSPSELEPMTTTKRNRFFNPMDGTYANVPILPVHAEKFRGKHPFGLDVLIGNWYEDHAKVRLLLSNELFEILIELSSSENPSTSRSPAFDVGYGSTAPIPDDVRGSSETDDSPPQ